MAGIARIVARSIVTKYALTRMGAEYALIARCKEKIGKKKYFVSYDIDGDGKADVTINTFQRLR